MRLINEIDLPISAAVGVPLIIVIAGPTGAGKSILEGMIRGRNGFRKCVSATTRPPRSDEENGRHYWFASSRAELLAMKPLETNEFDGHLYGMPERSVVDVIREGKRAVCHLDVNGVCALIAIPSVSQSLMTVFIDAPDDVLARRARERGGLSEERIAVRIETARSERKYAGMFEYRFMNDKDGLEHVRAIADTVIYKAERRIVEIFAQR